MEVTLCERFPAFTPLNLRREKLREVLKLIVRFNKYSAKKQKNANKPKIIRRPASDTWF
jgi:hypothetical protein